MLGKLQENQHEPIRTRFKDLINPNHEMAFLANKIDWQYFEKEFKPYYSDKESYLKEILHFAHQIPKI